jgi:quinol monooxygenase YgiN
MRYGVKFEMPGVTQEQYDALHAQIAPLGADATGFVAHISGPSQGGWYVIEVWESKADLERFIQEKVAPMMAPGAPMPKVVEEFEVYSRQTREELHA